MSSARSALPLICLVRDEVPVPVTTPSQSLALLLARTAGLCPACALRHSGIALTSRLAGSDGGEAVVDAAVRAAVAAITTLPAPPPLPCAGGGAIRCGACRGVLCSASVVRVVPCSLASGSTALKPDTAASPTIVPTGVDWGDALIDLIVGSGFDLRDACTLGPQIAPSLIEADNAARRGLSAAFSLAAPPATAALAPSAPLAMPPRAQDLREAVRVMALCALRRIIYRALPSSDVILSVAQAEEALLLLQRQQQVEEGERGGSAACGWGVPPPLSAAATSHAMEELLLHHPSLTTLVSAYSSNSESSGCAPPDPRAILVTASAAVRDAFSGGSDAPQPPLPPSLLFPLPHAPPLVCATDSIWVSLGATAPPTQHASASLQLSAAGGSTISMLEARASAAAAAAAAVSMAEEATMVSIAVRPREEGPLRRLAEAPMSSLTITVSVEAGSSDSGGDGAHTTSSSKRARVTDGAGGGGGAATSPAAGAAVVEVATRPPWWPSTVTLSVSRNALFIKGRYCKLLRGLSQTPWFIEGVRKALHSSAPVPNAAVSRPLSSILVGGKEEEGGEGEGSGGVVDDLMTRGAAAPATSTARAPLTSVEELLGQPIADALTAHCGAGAAVGVIPRGNEGTGAASAGVAPPLASLLVPCASTPPASQPLFTFHAAGREDVDVRMLGSGRPFVIELGGVRPVLVPLSIFRAMREDINSRAASSLCARAVAPSSRAEFVALQSGADSKRKQYVALAWSSKAYASQAELDTALARLRVGAPPLTLAQRTPIRVLHRRSLLVRPKLLHGARGLRVTDHFFLLHLTASAGTYVKEFVHGDLGRTVPNLSDVLSGRVATDTPASACGGGGAGGAHALPPWGLDVDADILCLDVVQAGARDEGEAEEGGGDDGGD